MSGGPRVVVVGGGIVGCAVAYYAARRGLDVTLVDKPRRGRATSASAGGLWPLGESLGLGCGVIFYKKRLAEGRVTDEGTGPHVLPKAFFDFAVESNRMHRPLAEELQRDTGIDVEWQETGLTFLMFDEADVMFARSLVTRFPESAQHLVWLDPRALAEQEPALTEECRGAVRFAGDDQVNPYLLSDALRAGAVGHGAKLRIHTNVRSLVVRGNRIVGVDTDEGTLEADIVVNAAGAWAGTLGETAGVELPITPVRGQIVCSEELPPGTLGTCISTSDCYICQKAHGEIIVGSTTEEVGFEHGTTPEAIRDLCRGAVKAIPALDGVWIKRVWSGLRPGTPDELPILGPVDGLQGYLNATGHFRTGILTAPLTGLILAEHIAGDELTSPLEPFLLSRFSTGDGAVRPAGAQPSGATRSPG